MAIRRCPYCKAIIDEKDKYCENCGTQLLFPEDEYEEEPIKGDKIVNEEEASEEVESEEEVLEEERESEDEEDEEEDTEETEDVGEEETEEEEEDEEEEREEDEEKDEEEEEQKEDTGGLNKFAESEKEEEEIYGEELDYGGEAKEEIEEPPEEEHGGELTGRTPTRVIAEEEERDERELQSWMALKEEIAKKAQAERQDVTPLEFREEDKEIAPEKVQGEDKKYKVSIEADELVLKTKELEQATRTVEEGKKDVENLLLSFEEGKGAKAEKPSSETKDELPPWISRMKEGPPSVTPSLELEAEAERGRARREWAVDSGIGIPEGVTQTTTIFTEAEAGAEKRHEEEELEKEVVGEKEGSQRRGFALKLKAKCVDLIFITALWLISLAFAAAVIGVSFFKIISVAPLPVLAFYLLLLLLYFFLFLYFLGETLGDHYFSAED